MALAVLIGACAGAPRPGDVEARPPAVLTGLRASNEDRLESHVQGGTDWLRWQTVWTLTWKPVPDAADYELTFKTSEGVSPKTAHLRQPPYRLEVAKGDNPKSRGLHNRAVQLATIQGLLAVQVRARTADGEVLAASPWLVVGREIPEGDPSVR